MQLVGLDVAGWLDVAARDWDPDFPDERLKLPVVVKGRAGSVAIRDNSDDWIGGPQATLAPHGRGRGWGMLGGADRRVAIADCFNELASGQGRLSKAYFAGVDALARHATSLVLNIPDVANFGEEARSRLLSCLATGPRRTTRLLWRPVAACLDAIADRRITQEDEGAAIGFLIHGDLGMEVQVLRLRADPEHHGHLAPERDAYGKVVLGQLALSELRRRVDAAIYRKNPDLEQEPCEKPDLAAAVLMGEATPDARAVLRHDNGNWIEFVTPRIEAGEVLPRLDRIDDVVAALGEVRKCFLVTPVCDTYAGPVFDALRRRITGLETLPWRALACGALRAGRLIERGLPHYFDRLTPIGLAVLKDDKPEFEDLIGSEAAVPANKEYVSPPYTSLEWGHGKKEIDFYVLKGSDEVRHWRVPLESAPLENVSIELRLRQTPGQSWAKLILTSPDWEPLRRSPIALDWAHLRPDERSPDQILDALRTPPPIIPRRIVQPPALACWHGDGKVSGLFEVLDGLKAKNRLDSTAIAERIARPYSAFPGGPRAWLVGTDGELPNELTPHERERFDELIAHFETVLLGAVQKKRSVQNNDALRILTWIFVRCPASVQNVLVEALEAAFEKKNHVLLAPLKSLTVVTQGVGRAVSDPALLKRVLRILAERSPNVDTLNALAMLLSRRKDAPAALDADLVAKIARLVAKDVVEQTRVRAFKLRFKCGISALAGLFRYREIVPYALLASRDPLAHEIDSELERTGALLEAYGTKISGYAEKIQIVESLREYLHGAGDPDILIKTDPFMGEDQFVELIF